MYYRYPYELSRYRKTSYGTTFMQRHGLARLTQRALQHTTKPLLEVGGPTECGFIALGKSRLPHGLLILNLVKQPHVDVIGDARALPFGHRSLGGIVMSGLTRIPEEIAQSPQSENRGLSPMFLPELMKDDSNVLQLLTDASKGNYDGWNDQEIMGYSQRLALLREARRTLEPKGLLIASILTGGEVRLATEQLGFDVIGTTVSEVNPIALEINFGEFVLQLNDLATPAGTTIEQHGSIYG